jgi:hypothetical protein
MTPKENSEHAARLGRGQRLSALDVQDIRKLRAFLSAKSLGRLFDYDRRSISTIITGETYGWVN